MREFFSLLLIGLALSMDTFSLSLGMGMFNVSNRKALKLALIVGSMHFMMPFLGVILGDKLLQIFEIKYDILLGFILIIIALQMIIDIIRHEEEHFNLSLVGMLIFSFGVSLDSFSLGLGLKAITSNKLLGVYANIIGAVILFVLGLIHLI